MRFFYFIFLFLMAASLFAANLSLSLSLTESTIASGSSTTLTATVSGSDSSVNLKLSGDGIGSSLTTDPASVSGVSTQYVGNVNSSVSKSWIIQGNTTGTYTLNVTATGDGASTSSSIVLTVATPASLVLDSNSISSDRNLAYGESFTISYTIKNNGGVSADVLNTISGANGLSYSSSSLNNDYVTIDAGESKSVVIYFKNDANSNQLNKTLSLKLTGANLSETITADYNAYAKTSSSNSSSSSNDSSNNTSDNSSNSSSGGSGNESSNNNTESTDNTSSSGNSTSNNTSAGVNATTNNNANITDSNAEDVNAESDLNVAVNTEEGNKVATEKSSKAFWYYLITALVIVAVAIYLLNIFINREKPKGLARIK